MHPKRYKIEEIWSVQPFGQMKNGLNSGRLACSTSSKILELKQYSNLDFNPGFSIQFKMYFNQAT